LSYDPIGSGGIECCEGDVGRFNRSALLERTAVRCRGTWAVGKCARWRATETATARLSPAGIYPIPERLPWTRSTHAYARAREGRANLGRNKFSMHASG